MGKALGVERQRLFKLLDALHPYPNRSKGLPDNLTGAVTLGDIALVRIFVERGADLEEGTVGFASPLAAACSAGRSDIAAYLLERGAKITIEGNPFAPMYGAVSHGHVDLVRMLMANGATAEDAAFGFPQACAKGRYTVVKLLVEAGLDLDRLLPAEGRTLRDRAINLAKMNSRPLIVAYLQGKPVDEARALAAEARAIKEDLSMARGLARDSGRTPVAVGEERAQKLADAVAIVKRAGAAAIAWKNEEGDPVLLVAAARGVAPIVAALLEAGADPNAAAPGRFTALTAAIDFGDPEIVRMLLAAGANPKVTPADGRSAMKRVRGPYEEEIKALLRAGPPAKPPRAARAKRRPS